MLSRPMRLLMDENVPDSVTDFFRARGHDVHLVRDLFLPGTPDGVIARLGDEMETIVVTWNHKDFKRLVSRVPTGYSRQFRRLGRINFRCKEPHGTLRAKQFIESIEFEYEQTQNKRDKRLMIEITETGLRIIR